MGPAEPSKAMFQIAASEVLGNRSVLRPLHEKKGVDMRKLATRIAFASALLLAGAWAWNAEATTLSGAAIAQPETNYSLIEKAGCWLPGLPGECEIGQHRLCDRFHDKACRNALRAQVGILGVSTSPRTKQERGGVPRSGFQKHSQPRALDRSRCVEVTSPGRPASALSCSQEARFARRSAGVSSFLSLKFEKGRGAFRAVVSWPP